MLITAMPSFFGGVTGKGSTSLFEIRLENDIIVLRGDETEASSQLLKGVVVLCLSAPLKVEDVHLKLTGQLKVGWNDQRVTSTGIANSRIEKATEIFTHKWPPFVTPGSNSRSVTLVPGNYEWPFELVVPGSVAESIEGMPDSHLIYKLKASVARGKLAYDLHAYKPVRIIRTLAPSALELAHAMTVENVWPNKIEYQLVIPQKAIIFGTAINIQLRFTSLLKGLKIGPIKCVLVETQDFTIPGLTAHTERNYRITRDVEEWNFDLSNEHYHDMIDDSGQDGYILEEMMPLPQRLQKCMQDVDVHGIKIRHKVKFNVALHNPDGHVSELRATLPITIFISPNMPLNPDGCVVNQAPRGALLPDVGAHAPPLYGEHILDQLYSDMDQSGIMTPAPQSGMNTPFYNMSRSGSSENLASLSGAVHTNGAVTPAALETRLQNLNLHSGSRNSSYVRSSLASGGNTPISHPHPDPPAYFDNNSAPHSASHSNSTSNPLSRRTSEEDHPMSALASGQHTPEHIDFSDLGDLTKVPSYATAVRAPARGMNYSEVVPNYDTAVTTPSSPPSPILTSPAPAVQSPIHTTTNIIPSVRRHSARFIVPHLITHPAPIHTGDDDERRRLHFLRNRERAH